MAEIRVQVCYVRPDAQFLREMTMPAGALLKAAIEKSGVLEYAPEIDLSVLRVGIFGKLKNLDTVLREHDRVEIYHPLVADPKESRRRRAVKSDNKKGR